MSAIAIEGLAFEKSIESDVGLSAAVCEYLGCKDIIAFQYPKNKKTDVVICARNEFGDVQRVCVQIKKCNGILEESGKSTIIRSRGNSIDRRNIKSFASFFPHLTEQMVVTFFLGETLVMTRNREKTKEHRKISNKAIMERALNHRAALFDYVCEILQGTEASYKPDIYLIAVKCGAKGKCVWYACKACDMLSHAFGSMSTVWLAKTCIWFGNSYYLQRKGGDKSDRRPNHCQMKCKITDNLLKRCKRIYLTSKCV
jgi:hypothetical protein